MVQVDSFPAIEQIERNAIPLPGIPSTLEELFEMIRSLQTEPLGYLVAVIEMTIDGFVSVSFEETASIFLGTLASVRRGDSIIRQLYFLPFSKADLE